MYVVMWPDGVVVVDVDGSIVEASSDRARADVETVLSLPVTVDLKPYIDDDGVWEGAKDFAPGDRGHIPAALLRLPKATVTADEKSVGQALAAGLDIET